MKKMPASAPHSPQPSTSSPRHPDQMEKDEQLQLCIQRFVSDAQSMMNQFTSFTGTFVGEIRRFADVCMEFSLAYRSVHDDRDFLAIENQSLKDELEARTGQMDMISKELREIREENEDLLRRLECMGVPAGNGFGSGSPVMMGTNSVMIMDPVAMSRHYAVVNSMPAFPRRYSVATSVASYENATTHGGSSYLATSHGGCSSASPTLQQTNPNSAHSNTVLLITPPIDFKSGASSPSSPMPDVPIELKRRSASLSKDDILAYIHKLERQEATKQRSPSVDHIPPTTGSSQPIFLSKVQSPTDPLSVSSSAGTFYDCISTCSVDNTRDPHTLTNEINRMCAVMVAHSDIGRENPETITNSISNRIGNEYLAADLPCFISKTPSPHSANYLRHYQLYMSKSQDDAREATFASGSGSELTEIDTSSSGQIYQSNSRKKNSIKEASSASEMIQQSKWYAGHPIDSVDFFENYGGHRFPEQVTTIPLPLLEMTRYLLVEVSHFISPSLFYLIVNDEKCGSNAFEDFLESFQNFYKSLEYLLEEEQQYNQNGFSEDPEETESDSEWKLYFTSAPMPESVVLGSYWAGYLDEVYEWRRVQVTQLVDASGSSEITITARDVDSGFSTRIYISSLRPLREEFGSIPAFAIRASLAYLYPRPYRSASTGSLQPEDALSVWPEECCRLFETLTFDQILTASIIEIQREDLTDTEIAQVLLWCSPSSGGNQEDEICINRKLIELNFAANVAEDDQWLLRSTESMNCPSSKSSQIIKQAEELEVPFEASSEIVSPAPNIPEMPTTKKKKLKKVLCKKKKESSPLMVDLEAVKTSIAQVPTAEMNCDPNVLLGEPSDTTLSSNLETCAIEICPSFYLSSPSLHHLNEKALGGDLCKFPLGGCPKLHHDPRLSNWILQKHSRHVNLKKSSILSVSTCTGKLAYPAMCYPFRVSTAFDVNKFSGILPFGERKLDTDAARMFIAQISKKDSKMESPFRDFVLEMTEFYHKFSNDYSLISSDSNSTFLEAFLQNQQQNQLITFYDSSGLYLRGYIVGKDPDTPRSERSPGSSHALNSILFANCKSLLENAPILEVKRKTLSLKRPKVSFTQAIDSNIPVIYSANCAKLIIYGIDTGRYYLVKSSSLFKLVDKFVAMKPFAIVCKLLLSSKPDETASGHFLPDRKQLHAAIVNRLLCLQFHDIDCGTERNLISLYHFGNSNESTIPLNILN